MSEYPESENSWIIDLALVILFGIFGWLVVMAANDYIHRAERAAYLEGRYDFDHATAWQIAGE